MNPITKLKNLKEPTASALFYGVNLGMLLIAFTLILSYGDRFKVIGDIKWFFTLTNCLTARSLISFNLLAMLYYHKLKGDDNPLIRSLDAILMVVFTISIYDNLYLLRYLYIRGLIDIVALARGFALMYGIAFTIGRKLWRRGYLKPNWLTALAIPLFIASQTKQWMEVAGLIHTPQAIRIPVWIWMRFSDTFPVASLFLYSEAEEIIRGMKRRKKRRGLGTHLKKGLNKSRKELASKIPKPIKRDISRLKPELEYDYEFHRRRGKIILRRSMSRLMNRLMGYR